MLSRPFSMVAVMIGAALMGAAGTMALQAGKHVNGEGIHAELSKTPQPTTKLDADELPIGTADENSGPEEITADSAQPFVEATTE